MCFFFACWTAIGVRWMGSGVALRSYRRAPVGYGSCAGRHADYGGRARHRLFRIAAICTSPDSACVGARRRRGFAAAIRSFAGRALFSRVSLPEADGSFRSVLGGDCAFGSVRSRSPVESGCAGVAELGLLQYSCGGSTVRAGPIRTGSLWFSCGLHFGWNLFQGAVFGLPVSGLSEFSTVVTASAQGSTALTGGAYGPEGSATAPSFW